MDCKGRSIVGSCTSRTAGAHRLCGVPVAQVQGHPRVPTTRLFYEPSHTTRERYTCTKLSLSLSVFSSLSRSGADERGVADLRRSTSRGRARRNNVGDGLRTGYELADHDKASNKATQRPCLLCLTPCKRIQIGSSFESCLPLLPFIEAHLDRGQVHATTDRNLSDCRPPWSDDNRLEDTHETKARVAALLFRQSVIDNINAVAPPFLSHPGRVCFKAKRRGRWLIKFYRSPDTLNDRTTPVIITIITIIIIISSSRDLSHRIVSKGKLFLILYGFFSSRPLPCLFPPLESLSSSTSQSEEEKSFISIFH